MTTSAIFLKVPAGLCIETDDNVEDILADGDDLFIAVARNRDGARVLVPVDNIADVIIGGHK